MLQWSGAVQWTRSARCASGACVEVSLLSPEAVGLRDSKDPDGGAIVFAPQQWRDFVGAVSAARYRRS
jgi:hypothetical protein